MANSSEKKAFKNGTKKILHNITKYCDQKAENREIIVRITQPTRPACQTAGVSVSNIKIICRKAEDELYPNFTLLKKSLKKIFLKKQLLLVLTKE